MLTAKELRNIANKLFTYDEDEGLLRWRYDRISRLKNHLTIKAKAGDVAGWINDSGYRVVMFLNKKRRASRIIWLIQTGIYPKHEIDHKNGNRSDDRFHNLREATSSQNHCNVKKYSNNRSGFKGVSWSIQRCKWRVTIRVRGKQTHLGFFHDVNQAALAYRNAAPIFHGEFARPQ